MRTQLLNSVLPVKIYQVWGINPDKPLAEVFADNVSDAYSKGRLDYGKRCRAVTLKGGLKP